MASASRQDVDADTATFQSSHDVWYLKQVMFKGHQYPIITQNFNGPCSFIAICNILILRGDIQILPRTRQTVSYEFLSQLVAEHLLSSSPNVDISAALSIMPYTQKGMDLNPLFTSATTFRPSSIMPSSSGAGGELDLFLLTRIPLVHGWLVDPGSPAARAMLEESTEDYDSAVALIAEADHLAGGMLVQVEDDVVGEGEAGPSSGGSGGNRGHRRNGKGPGGSWTYEERRKITNAVTIRAFLDATSSQLTYHGLFHLASTLPSGELVALFRSSHLSVLYKDGENLVIDGESSTFSSGAEDVDDEEELDYIDPVSEHAEVAQGTSTVPLDLNPELSNVIPNPNSDGYLELLHPHHQQQPEDATEPHLEPKPIPDTHTVPSSTSISVPTSTTGPQPLLPLQTTLPHSHLSNSDAEPSSSEKGPLSLTPSQPQIQVREPESGLDLETGVSQSQLELQIQPSSTSEQSSVADAMDYIPQSQSQSQSHLILPEQLTHSNASFSSGSVYSQSPSRLELSESDTAPARQDQAFDPQHLKDSSSIQEQPRSPPEQHHLRPQQAELQPEAHRPPSPLTQLRLLGRRPPSPPSNLKPSQIQQASSQGPSTASRSRTTETRISGAGGSALYTLVTDQVFLNEPSVVWERIEDVDGANGSFVDGWFVRSSPAGGDFAGRTAEETAWDIQDAEIAAAAASAAAASGVDPVADHELARRLQAEEEQYHYAQLEQAEREERDKVRRQRLEVSMRRAQREPPAPGVPANEAGKKRKEKKEKDCVVM